jgi:sulfonate transport system permease protein
MEGRTLVLVSRSFLCGLLLPLIAALVWEIAAHVTGSKLITPLETVVATTVTLSEQGLLWTSVAATVARVSLGFAIGSLAGLVFGSVVGTSRAADMLASPTFNAMRQVPLTGWIPVVALLFGIGESAKLSLISLAAFYAVGLNTADGFADVPFAYRELGRSLSLTATQRWRRVMLPAALPQILTGLKQGLAFAWIATIAAELLLTSGTGLGALIAGGSSLFRVDMVLVGVLMIAVCGLVMGTAMEMAETHLLKWRQVAR